MTTKPDSTPVTCNEVATWAKNAYGAHRPVEYAALVKVALAELLMNIMWRDDALTTVGNAAEVVIRLTPLAAAYEVDLRSGRGRPPPGEASWERLVFRADTHMLLLLQSLEANNDDMVVRRAILSTYGSIERLCAELGVDLWDAIRQTVAVKRS